MFNVLALHAAPDMFCKIQDSIKSMYNILVSYDGLRDVLRTFMVVDVHAQRINRRDSILRLEQPIEKESTKNR